MLLRASCSPLTFRGSKLQLLELNGSGRQQKPQTLEHAEQDPAAAGAGLGRRVSPASMRQSATDERGGFSGARANTSNTRGSIAGSAAATASSAVVSGSEHSNVWPWSCGDPMYTSGNGAATNHSTACGNMLSSTHLHHTRPASACGRMQTSEHAFSGTTGKGAMMLFPPSQLSRPSSALGMMP
jgi:hypothetical protein